MSQESLTSEPTSPKPIPKTIPKTAKIDLNPHQHHHNDHCVSNCRASTDQSLKSGSIESKKQFEELCQYLPDQNHPQYTIRRKWLSHVTNHRGAITPDFVVQLGRTVHLVDIRPKEEILSPVGYIRNVNWFPKDNNIVELIQKYFQKDDLLVFICSNENDSNDVVEQLQTKGYHFVAVLAGGMRSWKLMGFSSIRDQTILQRKSIPIHPQHNCDETCTETHELINLDQIIEHLGDGNNVQFIKMASFMLHHYSSCIDGRDDTGVIGVPGGDMGEFIVHLATIEQLMNEELSESDINTLFKRRLDTFGRFYMHTDQTAADKLLKALENAIGPQVTEIMSTLPIDFAIHDILSQLSKQQHKDTVLHILTQPEHIGCGHIKLMVLNSDKYRLRPGLVQTALRCFFKSYWVHNGAAECDFVILRGSHHESGVANITVNREIQSYTKIPLISPSIQNKSVFVNHGPIAQYLRRQHSQWILEQNDIVVLNKTATKAYSILADLNAENHAAQTVAILAKGLPMYTLEFCDDHTACTIHYDGVIGEEQSKKDNDDEKHNHSAVAKEEGK